MAEVRQAIHAYVSEQAHETWQEFAGANGVSMTALLETLGQELAGDIQKAEADGGDATDIRQAWVKAARKIDAQRRRRGADR